ncbi:MAG: ABC transporter ATP-binding protein [Gracilibacteraceae bacterium]|jgi:putative ABC transport system ATP-binding protein|nr:ABC transporter ATP-binding protein [Gracilibacteraceae bacterium]
MSEALLTAENLSRQYTGGGVPVHALRAASFTIAPAECIIVLGPSGSGKSTLLNIIGGMDTPTTGRLCYGGRDVSAFSARELTEYRRDAVGFIFQFFNLIPSLTALENVALAAAITAGAMSPPEALALVGLAERGAHFPSQLSGGEQQRVSIARAIVKNPALFLCDEPTGALDTQNSATVVRLLLQMRDRLGCPVVIITHNTEIARAGDRIFHMKDGLLEKISINSAPVPVEDLQW